MMIFFLFVVSQLCSMEPRHAATDAHSDNTPLTFIALLELSRSVQASGPRLFLSSPLSGQRPRHLLNRHISKISSFSFDASSTGPRLTRLCNVSSQLSATTAFTTYAEVRDVPFRFDPVHGQRCHRKTRRVSSVFFLVVNSTSIPLLGCHF